MRALSAEVPGVVVDFDPVTGSSKWVGSNARLLTGPKKELAARDNDGPVRAFINANREVFGHDARALDSARRVTDYSTQRGPSRKVVWHQQYQGIDVFEAVLQANLTTESALINIGSQFVRQPENAAQGASTPVLTVQQAVAVAGQNVGEKMTAESVRPMGPPAAQPDRRQQFRAAMLTDADAKLTWVPMNESSMRLAWDVTLTSRSRAEMYRVLVDAEKGDVLVRQALTAYISDATYRVFTTESPTPMSPGHEKPSSLQPVPTSRVLVTTPALNTTASPNGWINDGGNITSGNNTDAYTDTNADDAADLPRTTGTGRVFDFPHDLTQEPTNFKDASVTQLFYWSNFMHDRMYELGFTEAAGNFQTDNFGRGGVGNDPVNSEAQDGSGTNNANFSTPVDGGRGRMQMYNWTNPSPDRDGSFEAEVVLHEYGHGVSNRLVGGPSVTISALSTRGMGEGWSDFYGLALTAEATDNPHGNWSRGAWSRYLSSGWLSENYYYGARRYSYSTDMLKNPHTLRDIDPTQVDWHTSVPRNPTYAATQDATQVHYQGTVWCVALWDLRANLILKHGFAIGNDRALFLVTEGMKYGPANPNFIQSRDGILQAALVNHPGDLGEVWTAFAKRGMGDGATAPASSTTTGIVEQYDVPDSLEISDRSGWNIEGNKGGPFSPATKTLTLSNDGASTINWSSNPNASWLSVTPASGSLVPGANVTVTVTTQANAMEPGFHSTNLVFTNTGTSFNQPIGVRLYVTPPVAVSFDLSTDPGWTTSGQWAYGTPAGSGGSTAGGAGNADPSGGATGSSVFGVNLAGNAATAVGGPFYLTSTPVDLSTRKTTRLRFKRWLNTNVLSSTRATVEVSTDGTTWREVFVNPGTAITENAWQTMEYDISSIADQQPAVRVRWSYQNVVAGTAYSGWNIDDVEFLGEPTAQFSIAAASTAAESGSPITATLNLNLAQDTNVTVSLSSSNTAAATVPASLTLLAGETSKTFVITPVDDPSLDGTQTTVITASTSANVAAGTHTLAVTDDETAVLTLTAPASAAEGSTGLSGSVSVSAAPTQNVTVQLSAASSRLLVPASVVIPSGSTGPVSFTFDAADNLLAEGPQNVVLTASVANWTSGTATVTVNDDESPAIVLTGPSAAREGDGPQTYTVTVNTVQATGRTLSLASSDTSELTVPASVVIPAGQFSASFDAAPQNDVELDGAQNATLTASSAGFPDATRVVSIADNEVGAYTFAAIASPQKRSKPFDVAITARDINGAVITNHSGSVALTSSSAGGAVPFSPNSVSGFVNGAATAQVTVTATATGMTLTATDAGGKTGLSNAFDVQPVTHDTFVFSGLPASANSDTAFNATATAVDDLGGTVTTYTDSTVVDILGSYFDRTVGSTSTSTGTDKVHNTAAHDSRCQIIYTAAELGGTAKLLSSLFVSRLTTGGQAMLNYKLRLKHTTLNSFDGRSWEEDGWTTVFTSASFTASSTSHTFNLKPFAYDGVRNLMVDISFDNSTASTAGTLRQTPAATNRMLSGTSNSAHGDPTTWAAASGPVPVISNELPTMQFNEARSLGTIPASPVAFTSGVWSGQAVGPTGGSMWLRATAPSGVTGMSNLIIIGSPSTTVGTDTIFTDGFETGVLGASWSTAGNSGATARTQVTTANTPKTGTYHLTMDTTSTTTGTFAANRPTLTLNLAGRKNVSLEWFAKSFADDFHSPTLTGPLGTFASTMNYDGVAISQDGVTWVEVSALRNLASTYGTTATRVFLDPVIQRLGWSFNSTFQLRFSQYDDQAIANDGIGIDDVAVKANPTTAIAVNLPPTITEGTLNQSVTVSLPAAAASNTSITLTSNAPARLSIASPVTIFAGQTSTTTTISAPQNAFVDAGKGVIVTASATGQTTSYTHVRVVDDEQPVLTLALPVSVIEGGSGTGTVFIEPVQPVATTVFFVSGNTAEATVSASASITAGARSTTFTITPVNDVRLDGTQTVSFTASGQGLVSANGSVDVLDNETMTLSVTPSATLSEGGAPGVGTVALSGPRTVDTSITLASSDTTEATVTSTVLIPAGQASINFQVFPIEDSVQDGTQSVTLTASSAGFSDGSASFQVRDNDPASFEWAIVPSPQTRNAPFAVTLTARDATDNTLSGFNGSVTLSAHSGATSLPLSATSSGTFVNGVWSGSLAVGAASPSVTLLATGGDGATGTSDAFEVIAGGAAVALAFTPVTSPHPAGATIPVQVSAVDAAGILVNEATGPVTVELVTSPGGAVVASASLILVNGAASTTFQVPAAITAVRLQGTAGPLTGQSSVFAIATPALISYPPPQVVFTDGFEDTAFKPEWTITGTGTHRTIITTANGPRTGSRHMTMDSTIDVSDARNEATLTLNLAGKSDVELSFWMKESGDEDNGPPTLPFIGGADFDGVAISTDGNTWYEVKGLRTADGISGTYTQFKVNLSAAATTHGLVLGSAFRIRFNHFDNYTYGTDGFAFDDIAITANAYAPQEPVATLFEDDFESGVFRPQWAITGTGNHRTEITSQQSPRGGYHMLMDVHATGNGRNEATLTLDVSGQQDLVLKFWMKENSDEDQAPPTNPFTAGADFDGVAVSTDGTTWYEVQALRGGVSTNTYQEFTVDLSAAATSFGFTPGAGFQIRFNHFDNSPWASGDGFAFDDIRVTGRPVQQLVLSAPATLAEGGSAMANVSLPAVRAVDTVITLATNRPGGVTVPATVTIVAGDTVSADFPISAAQDAFLTGSLPFQVVATAEGFRRSVVEMAILDNETPAGFDLSLPATLAEGGTISGTVSMTSANLFDLSVALSASPANGLTLPLTVSLPAGGTSTTFDLSKAENDIILEPASTTVTASVGSGSDSAAVSLTDNDASTPLVITLPASVLESAAPLTGSVGFAPPVIAGTDVTVTLASSDTSELTVPASVVIPAGAGSVSFNITPVDDALSDGAVAVTLTASASDLTGDTHEISVRDDEVHHFAFDPISSPQLALGAFSITLRAESTDNQTVTNFTGTATLSGANAGGAVSMTPASTAAFLNGVWTGPVTIPAPASAVTLTANAAGGLTGSSNSFDVIAGPTLAIVPGALNVTTPQGEDPMSQALALSNPGTGSLNWSVSIIGSAPWLSLSSSSGTIAQGGNANLTATFSPGVLTAGVYNATLRFTSNDPASPQQDVPVTFTLTAPVHHFDWSTIPSPQVANVPFAATLTAKDDTGNTLTGFNGSARLSLLGPILEVASGTASGQLAHPFWSSSYTEYRTQYIYLPGEVGGAGRIQQISFYQSNPQGSLANLVIRLKHTTKADYTTQATWESTGWTVVYQNNQPATTAGGWMALNLSTPFEYDGVRNLMVDVSFDNLTTTTSSATWATSNRGSRVLAGGTTANSSGSPLSWSGTSPTPGVFTSLTNIRFTRRTLVATSPSQVSFTGGIWSGNLAGQTIGTSLVARAEHTVNPAVIGESNTFDVTSSGSLSLSMPASGTEGGALNGTVTASVAPASDLTVTFASSDTSEAVPSASATILAGQTSAAFTVNLPEDEWLDGSQAVVISATAPAYNRAQATMAVNDNETTTLTLTLPATLAEGTSSTTGQASVQLATQAAADLTLSLSSSLTSRLSVPASVVIPAGQSSAAFTLTAPNNSIIDGNQDAVITATLAGSTPATGTVQVTDNESRALSLILLTTSMSEGGAANTTAGYISLAGSVPAPLTINLTSSDTGELNVSGTVTVNAGSSSSGYFTLTPVNDTAFDGTQAVTITATAATFNSATSSAISVLDDDVHHFNVSNVTGPLIRNGAFDVTFTAKDINNTTISGYTGTPVLSAVDGSTALTITPSTLSGFSSGSKTQSVSVGDYATNAVITVTDTGSGGSGSSNAFGVTYGAHTRFAFDNIASPQMAGQPFATTIRAQDAYGNTVSSYTGTAALSAPIFANVGTAASTMSYPFYPYYDDVRTQVIYTSAELGTARNITSVAFDVTSLPSATMSNFTIRMRHTAKSDYSGTGGAAWESTSWTTCYTGNVTINATGWTTFVFTTPFAYDGAQNVMVDISFSNAAATFIFGGVCRATTGATTRSLVYGGLNYSTSPLTWTGTSSPAPSTSTNRPDVRFGSPAVVSPSPAATGSFVAGVWTGPVTVSPAAPNVQLQAADGAITGLSNSFNVNVPPALGLMLPATVTEQAGGVSGTVSITSALPSDLAVNLSSNTPTAAEPATATVVIPSGTTSAGFTLNVINDAIKDGTQTAVITATATGLQPVTANISVLDDDVHNFLVSTINSPQVRNLPFSVTFTARDINNVTILNYAGTPSLSAVDGTTPVSVSPGSLSGFVSGVCTQNVTIGDFASNAVLTITDAAAGASGSSNAFATSTGSFHHFVVAPVSSQVKGQAFPVTITAKDAANNTVSGYAAATTLDYTSFGTFGSASVGSATGTAALVLSTTSSAARSQHIYLASELGGASRMRGIRLAVATAPPAGFNNFTIRMKHTTLSAYPGATSPPFEDVGWTTVYSSSFPPLTTGSVAFDFATPFEYNGVNNLLLDLSFTNASGQASSGALSTFTPGGFRSAVVLGSASPSVLTYGTPVASGSATTSVPVITFVRDNQIVATPVVTGAFSAGVWTGNITVNTAVTGLVIRPGGSSADQSNAFDVLPSAPVITAEPAFTGGTSNILNWSALSGVTSYRVQSSLWPDFSVIDQDSGEVSTTSKAFDSLTSGQTYRYRLRATAPAVSIAGKWSQTQETEFVTDTLASISISESFSEARLARTNVIDVENFDGPGAPDLSVTLFSDTSAGSFTRSTLSAGPSTTPELPINQGGDMEARLTGLSASALMPSDPANVFSDGSIEACLGPEGTGSFLYTGLLLRASRNGAGGTLNGYLANLITFAGGSASVSIVRMVNGAESAGINGILYPSVSLPALFANEHWKMRFSVSGPTLVVQVWKVKILSGAVNETLVATVTRTDYAYSSGVAGLYTSQSATNSSLFDDITVTKGNGGYASSGTIATQAVSPPSRLRWGTLSFNATTPVGTSLGVDVVNGTTDALLASSVPNGTVLDSIPAIASASSIKLRARLDSTNSALTPTLQDWTLTYPMLDGSPSTSAWSSSATSTQDASPPALVPEDLTTTGSSATLTGTAADSVSGIASVKVAGNTASTSDGFAHWTRSLTALADGSNSFTVTAADNAVPPNTVTMTAMVFRIASPAADSNQDGISALLEHALGIPAGTANARAMLPAAVTETDAGSGQKYLSMQFRRRIQRAGMNYIVETSSNLSTWDGTGANVVEKSVVPVGDGITETVTVRITPAMNLGGAKFVRLRVTTN